MSRLLDARLPILIAFLAGVALTLGFKDVYPDLERRFRRRRKSNHAVTDRRSSLIPGQPNSSLKLQDGSSDEDLLLDKAGLESCIGNTPLIKIKSLSDETGCEILAKAEFLNGCGGSPKDRVALSVIERVSAGFVVSRCMTDVSG